jgi:hypothetical protein
LDFHGRNGWNSKKSWNESTREIEIRAAEGDGSYEAEYRLVLPSGEIRWIGSHGRVEFDSPGKPILVRGVSNDITARKEAELEIQNLRREIAHVGRVSMMGQLASALDGPQIVEILGKNVFVSTCISRAT